MGVMLGAVGNTHTAECISFAHPDKLMDRVADAIVDAVLQRNRKTTSLQCTDSLATLEGVVRGDRLILMGEIHAAEIPDVESIVRRVWEATCCRSGVNLSIINEVVLRPVPAVGSSPTDTLADPGIVVGYATDETPEMLPREFVLARRLWERALACRDDGLLPWMSAAMKTQVTLDADGRVTSAGLVLHYGSATSCSSESAQERRGEPTPVDAYSALKEYVFTPVLSEYHASDEPIYTVHGLGSGSADGAMTIGAARRRSVMDAYGPRIPLGGDGCAGKDPADVTRCGSYMARYIARAILAAGMARECLVRIAYAIGSSVPVMISAITEEGRELGAWVRAHFDLSPFAIIERFGLRQPRGWSYYDTAAYGHFGYDCYPWEREM